MQDSADNESDGAVELRSSRARQPKKPRRGDLTEPETAIGDEAVKNVGTGTTTPAIPSPQEWLHCHRAHWSL